MRSRRCKAAALSVVLGLFAIPCFAESIIINGDPPVDFTIVTTTSFGFGSNQFGGGDFGFTNASGQVWTRLDVLVTVAHFEGITCGSLAFGTCTVTPLTSVTESPITFDIVFGPNTSGGIANSENFTVNLNDNGLENTDPNGAGSWTPGREFTAVANAPEPGSFLLGCLGLSLVGCYCLRASGLLPKRFSKAAN